MNATDVNFSLPAAPAPAEQPRGKLCLNMIVKNESRIIARLINSVLPIIDTYCICDTGSTDNTASIILETMSAAGKPGVVFNEPFQNFGYNRTVALARAAEWGEYALLLDADMKLVITPEFNPADLSGVAYMMLQRGGGLEYYNTRIVRTDAGITCVGPTHEYYNIPRSGGSSNAKLTSLWIDDVGDGGAKADKFERDVRLLKAGLETEPNNGRYYFYLANTYRDMGQLDNAIAAYKRRVELGGWIEEVFYACYEAGNCYNRADDAAEAIYWWLEAYNRHPRRAESLYEIVKYYRIAGKHTLSQTFLDIARKIPYPVNDVLFIKSDIYKYLLDYEQSIIGYYTGRPLGHRRFLELLAHSDIKQNVLSNYKFYVKKLTQFGKVHNYSVCASYTVRDLEDNFNSSTPCIIPDGDGYVMNVRFVNYTINSAGGYDFKHGDGKIITLNRTLWLDRKLQVVRDHTFTDVHRTDLRYLGVEDVKLYKHGDAIQFIGTVEHPDLHTITLGRGAYDTDASALIPAAFTSPQGRGCEKNWCYCTDSSGALRIVYEWFPLTLYDETMQHVVYTDASVPHWFRELRGSSNGVRVDDEVWFLCHFVEYTVPRHYYHVIVVCDAATLSYKHHSIAFKFHGDCIEYGLGLVVEADRVLISYSRMDRSSEVIELQRDVVERELFGGGTEEKN